ncbi:AAA family ATPase [Ectopseudomonas hydrolytica]|uniref:AAA family ATPase n=1 Tax=Ectopseudomonas hydrolytica TaxID=2493633 RepID=UPI003C2D64C6
MRNVYQGQLQIAVSLTSPSESLSYLCSILRSLLQCISISALETVIQTTPSVDDDIDLKPLLDRFGQPSDGLPVEILDALVPRIRSLVFRNYMHGWYEAVPGSERCLVDDLQLWVAFRNGRPAHGVLDAPTTSEWASKTAELIRRILGTAEGVLPVATKSGLVVQIGDLSVPVTTPLLVSEHAVVIKRIVARKGVLKAHGHLLSWTDAREFTIDLRPGSVFATESKEMDKFRWTEVPVQSKPFLLLNNVPCRQTSTFVGRSKELDKLKEWMGDISDSRACLVFGDGGFGKTTLVLEFFNSLLEGSIETDFQLPSIISFYTAKRTKWTEEGLIHFKGISEAMEDSVRELLYCLSPVLGKEWYRHEGRSLIDKAAQALTDEGFDRNDVLLIIDNTETMATSQVDAQELGDFISMVARRIGRVVITSRRREILNAEPLPVSQLSQSEALLLLQKLGTEYGARSISQAGEARLRSVCTQLMCKPLLIDTLVRYIARSSSGIQDGLDQILKKTNDELLEFLYEDAWARMTALVQKVFVTLVSLASPLDGKCVGDVCTQLGVLHAEFQGSLGETYFSTIIDRGDTYDLEIVELAKEFFRQKKKKLPTEDAEFIDKIAMKVDKQATVRFEIEKSYRTDRVADGFRNEYAKAAKIAMFKKDNVAASENFELALLEEPLNAALHERYASFLFRTLGKANAAYPFAERATSLDEHSADAWLTFGLIKYKLGDLAGGDDAIDKALKFGKTEQLCSLRKGIARYHFAKQEPYGGHTVKLLKEAEVLVAKSTKTGVSNDFYYHKNRREAEKYISLIRNLSGNVKKRISANSPQPER